MATLRVCVRKTCPSGTAVPGASVQIDADYGGPSGTTNANGYVDFMYLKMGYHSVSVNGVFIKTVMVLYYNETCCEEP